MFEGFERRRVQTSGAELAVRLGGSGPPLLLLHGYPQTSAIWHKVAPALAERFTLVMPDMRGYGESSKPPSDADHRNYSKRTMAGDMVELMAALGHSRFDLCGHDRGARVAYRLALDSPGQLGRLALLDIVPTWEQFERAGKDGALGSFHWYFLAQPAPFPERMIGADPDYFLRHLLASWSGGGYCFAPEAMAEYLRAFRDPETIRATCEDYRAGPTIDHTIDGADRAAGKRITAPLHVLWGGRRGRHREVLEVWRIWADEVTGRPLDCGHFLPEEAPEETTAELLAFFTR